MDWSSNLTWRLLETENAVTPPDQENTRVCILTSLLGDLCAHYNLRITELDH